jgi:hypothetical protein|tara:strand:- start:421 stop:609 length:189 start_codon:yes stop_codon:yes gene_type:complete
MKPIRADKQWTWWPKRMSSGKLVYCTYYYYEEFLRTADPRHNWVHRFEYTKREYFIKIIAEK